MANTDIQITEQAMLDAARKYDKTLRTIPMIAMQDTLRYVTVIPNIQGDLVLGTLEAEAHWAPYRKNDTDKNRAEVAARIISTHLCSLEMSFDPNQVAAKLWQQRPNIGEGLKNTPIAAQVLMDVQRRAGENMNNVLFTAKYDAVGTEEKDCFDGWDTIAEKEIADEKMSAAKGNFLDLSANTLDQNNTFDAINYIYASCDAKLKGYISQTSPLFIYCSPNIQQYYNMGLKEYLGSIPYNKQWNQPSLLGSNGNAILVPIMAKANSNFIQVSTKGNMIFGTDRLNDMNSYTVKVPGLFDVLAGGTMWAGCDYESIDKTKLMVVKIGGVAAPINPFTAAADTPGTRGSETLDTE